MELMNIDKLLDEQFGKQGTPERKAAIRQAKAELKNDLRYFARRGEKVTLRDILCFNK